MTNIVRQDVVRIDVDSSSMLEALEKVQRDIDKLQRSFGIMDSGLEGLKDSFTGVGDKSPFPKVKEEVDRAKKSTEQTNKEAEKVKKTFEDIGKTKFSGLISGLKKVGAAAAKITVAGFGAASAGAAGLVGASVGAYADYEQLVGGVETLFKDSAPIVKEYADNAYKSAGLSANEYMESITGFSASLLGSMGGDTKAAAELANQAIIDMSDNANKMGSDMESIQNAYQGFAKYGVFLRPTVKAKY